MSTSNEIRQQFIDFFLKRHGHDFVASSPVVPHDDPTLLFTNAGMNQFKDVFLATGKRDYTRAANSQKCIRAGGKHNDLEDVGKDTYHHTFFEMLGNWSFGDYFKKEAIAWGWELLTEVWGLDKSRLHATVFKGDASDGLEPDSEAAKLWTTETDIDPAHIHYCGKKDNFWEMGNTGPCGPCSEIHFDLTPDKSGAKLVNRDDPRVIEIWNLVFIQFNRDSAGKLTPLLAKHVDTGMGLERVCAVLQGKSSNYDTDLFTPLFQAIQQVTGARPYAGQMDDKIDIAYRVIADHIRCLTFALTDGAVPSNEGRGYVLRRILRRAVRHGWQTLGVHDPFLSRLVPAVVEVMGEAFPELKSDPTRVIGLVKEEEKSFAKTLDRGIALFEHAAKGGKNRVSAEDAFKLHDTFGFPLDLTQVMAQERGMTVDVDGFDRLMEQARQMSRGTDSQSDVTQSLTELVQQQDLPATGFVGYDQSHTVINTPLIMFRLVEGGYRPAEQASADEQIAVVVEETPFYAEAGGQVGDTGEIEKIGEWKTRVENTIKVGPTCFHLGKVTSGRIDTHSRQKATLTFRVDPARRLKIMGHHTGTHLLNRALRDVLGDQVQQRGSLVDDTKLRFDFSHSASVTPEETDRIERMVNEDIAADLPVYASEAPQEDALKIHGLRAVFGEKYPPKVRVVSIGASVADLLADPTREEWMKYSIEFCGGTHLTKTGDAEGLVILSEEAVSKGVRRITALTGRPAHSASAAGDMLLGRLEGLKGLPPEELSGGGALSELLEAMDGVQLPLLARTQIRTGITELQKKIKEHQKQQNKASTDDVVELARNLAEQSDGEWMVSSLQANDSDALRTAMDVIRKKRPDVALLLGAVTGDKVVFVASVPKPLIERGLKAGDWVKEAAKVSGGGGGGRPDMAQAGGKDPEKLDDALEAARAFVKSKL